MEGGREGGALSTNGRKTGRPQPWVDKEGRRRREWEVSRLG